MTRDLESYASSLCDAVQRLPFDLLERAADTLLGCYRNGGTVFLAGNGGSAAIASHFACDLTKGTRHDALSRFRVVALTDNIPLMTAWGNDASYDRIFAEQLTPLVRPGDVVLLISASGDSANIVVAAEAARDASATTIALTGPTGGLVAGIADLTIRSPAGSIEAVEDSHSIICHGLTVTLRRRLATLAV